MPSGRKRTEIPAGDHETRDRKKSKKIGEKKNKTQRLSLDTYSEQSSEQSANIHVPRGMLPRVSALLGTLGVQLQAGFLGLNCIPFTFFSPRLLASLG